MSKNTLTIYRKQEIVRNSDDFQLEVRLWLGSHVEISRQLRLSADALVIPSSLSSLAVSAISAVVEDIQDQKKASESIDSLEIAFAELQLNVVHHSLITPPSLQISTHLYTQTTACFLS